MRSLSEPWPWKVRDLTTLEMQNEQFRNEVDGLKRQVATGKDAQESLTERFEDIQKQLADAVKKNKALGQKIAERDRKINDLESALADAAASEVVKARCLHCLSERLAHVMTFAKL